MLDDIGVGLESPGSKLDAELDDILDSANFCKASESKGGEDLGLGSITDR